MADGSSRAVEALHAGDYVLAKDEKTGSVEAQEVTATVHHPAATLVTVTFAGTDGKVQAVTCTPEHPFFVDGKGWVEAGSLGIGTSIVTRAGPTLAVKSLDWKRSAQAKPGLAPGLTTPAFTVYNFTVDQDHTFFVGTAQGGAWTHNNTCTVGMDLSAVMEKSGLKPTQAAVSAEKVNALSRDMIQNGFKMPGASNPMIVDQAGNIMAGHHRFVAAALAGMKVPESAVKTFSGITGRASRGWTGINVTP